MSLETRREASARHYEKHKGRIRPRANALRKARRDSDSSYKERTLEESRRWRAMNRAKYLRSLFKADLKRHYGMTLEQWHFMLRQTAGSCTVSGEQPKELCIDHCHKTGLIRGLLSHRCNKIIGLAEDDPQLLHNLAEYLEDNRALL